MLLVLLMIVPMTVSLAVPASAETVKYEVEGGYITFDLSTGTITRSNPTVTSVDIPAYIDGVEVKAIGENAFSYCLYLESLTLPDTVTTIGEAAFYNCESLTSVVIPDGVTDIGDSAFERCSLMTVTIPDSVIRIGETAFSSTTIEAIEVDENNKYYSEINGVVFNKNKTELLFYPTGKSESYIIPDGVIQIGKYAFSGCILESVDIPEGLINIEERAFNCCYNLTSITLPNSVTNIGEHAFSGCSSLTSIVIPRSVTSYDYFHVKKIIYGGTKEDWDKISIGLEAIPDNSEIVYNTICGVNGHSFDEWVNDSEVNCTENGNKHRVCLVCEEIETLVIPALGHEWGEWIISVHATCTSVGAMMHICSVCKAVEYEEIPNNDNHIYGEWITTVKPTVTTMGERSRTCSNCNFVETEKLDKITFENPFNDVKPDQWYTSGILWCYEKGYMAGVSDTEFGRKSNVTRAMFATILAKIDGADTSVYKKMSFSDVPAGQWYSGAIEWAYQNGYAAGLGEGYFGRKDNVSREQIALFFYTYSSKNGVDVSEKADLSAYTDLGRVHSWALDAVQWAVAKGLISGTSDTTLSPRDSATRAEIALVVKNYVETVKN